MDQALAFNELNQKVDALTAQVAFLAEEARLEKTLRDCFRKIKMGKLKRDEEALLRRIREIEQEDRQDLLGELLVKRQHLVAQERNLIEMYKSRDS